MRSGWHSGAGWFAAWAGGALLVVILGLAAYAGWLFARDHAAAGQRRLERMQALAGEQRQLREGLAGVNRRIADLQVGLAAQDERRQLAERAAATLRAGDSWWRDAWERLFGDAAAARTREEQLARLDQARAEAGARGAELRAAITRATWERDGAEIALGRVERRLAAVAADRPGPAHYLARAWQKLGWYAAAALALLVLAPTAWHRWRGRRA